MKSRSKIQDNNGNGSPQDRQSIVVKTKPVVDSTVAYGDQNSADAPNVKVNFAEILTEQPVILERTSSWGRAFTWIIIGMTTSALIWSALAQIEQAVPAVGRLQPSGAVKEVQPPAGGVVREILVKAGQKVKKGDLLITFDPTAPEADLESQKKLKDSLEKENKFYDVVLNGGSLSPELIKQLFPGGISPDLENTLRLRNSLAQEAFYYQALAEGKGNFSSPTDSFDLNQQKLLVTNNNEIQSRILAKRLQIESLNQQLLSNQAQLNSARNQMQISKNQLLVVQDQIRNIQNQLITAQQQFEESKNTYAINQAILDRIKPVVDEGGLPELQLNQQQKEMSNSVKAILSSRSQIENTQKDLISSQNQYLSNQKELSRNVGEEEQLSKDAERIKADINRAEFEYQNTIEGSKKEILMKIADNQKQIAQIDSQFGQKKIDNQKQIAQIDGNLKKSEQSRQYQELRAPVDGIVFDLKASGPGYVAKATEPIVKIVPQDGLEASVFLTNKDIGFIKEGMKVQVDVDSFPALEFGTIPGKLKSIGEDVLPPTQERPYYAFPATIELERQSFLISGKEIPLQSGMSVNTKILVRKRTVLSIFTDLFLQKSRSLETVR